MTFRPSTAGRLATSALAVFALIAVSLTYAISYFSLGQQIDWHGTMPVHDGNRDSLGVSESDVPSFICRTYPQRWMAVVYAPLASLEGQLRGVHVKLDYSK